MMNSTMMNIITMIIMTTVMMIHTPKERHHGMIISTRIGKKNLREFFGFATILLGNELCVILRDKGNVVFGI